MVDAEKSKMLKQSLRDMDQDPEDVFHDEFMQENTEFSSFKQFLKYDNWLQTGGDVSYKVTIADADELVSKKTGYDSWQEMSDAAIGQWWDEENRNRREYRRYPCDVQVVMDTGMDQVRGKMVDVSKNGMQLKTDEAVPNVRTLEVQVPLKQSEKGSKRISIRGAVRWKTDESPFRMGVEILNKKS